MKQITTQKAALRKQALAARKPAHAADTGAMGSELSAVLAGNRGVPLAGYMPIRTEIDPLPAMAEAAAYGPVGVPVIAGEGQPLDFSLWEPDAALRDGPFGAQVPKTDRWMTPQIVIVPLVAFDENRNRLGYGGGFYDRTLARLMQAGSVLSIGFAYDEQEVESVPTEPTDIPLNMIVTQTRILTQRVG